MPAIDRAAYESRVREHLERSRYFPFKHVWRLAQLVVAPAPAPDVVPQPRPGFAAMTFLAIVDQARDLLRGRHLIVLETNGYNANNARFATALRRSAAHADLLAELASMHVIDTSSFLTDDDYYLVDDHMRANGHDKIARAIVDIINGAGRWRVVPAGETVAPAGPANGSIEAVEHKGGLTLIRGWAARRDTGEPAAAVALLRNGLKLAEAEPVQARTDIADALAKPSAGFSGYWLVVPTERLAGAQSLAVVATWPDGRVSPLEHQEKLRGGD